MKKRREIDAKTWSLIRRVAENIRSIRKKKGLTQEDMEAFGFGHRWYQRFESGKHIPTLPTLDLLARAFKIDISDFFK